MLGDEVHRAAAERSAQMQAQVMGLGAELRQQDTKVTSLSQNLAESQRANAELRGQVRCGTMRGKGVT